MTMKRFLGIALGLAVLLWVVRAVVIASDELGTFAWQIEPVYLGLGFATYSVGLLLAIRNWGDMLARLERPTPFRANLWVYCSANLMKRLPGVFWHFVGRAALYRGHGISARATTVASTLELVLYALASGLLYLGLAAAGSVALVEPVLPVAALTVVGLALLHPRLANLLTARLYPAVGQIRTADVASWLALNGGVVALGGGVLFWVLRSALPVSPADLPLVVGAWCLAAVASNVLFFVPGGIGVREGVLVAALSPLAPVPILAVLAVAFRLWLIVCELVWAALAAVSVNGFGERIERMADRLRGRFPLLQSSPGSPRQTTGAAMHSAPSSGSAGVPPAARSVPSSGSAGVPPAGLSMLTSGGRRDACAPSDEPRRHPDLITPELPTSAGPRLPTPDPQLPAVAVVLLNWNGREDTLRCLDSVGRLDYPALRTILVDNGSVDGTEEAVRAAFPGVEVVQTGANLGYGRGMNAGIERAMAAGAEYVLLLNNDTLVDPPMLRHLVAAMEADPQLGIAGPKTLYLDGCDNRIFYAGAYERWLTLVPDVREVGKEDRGQLDRPGPVDFVWGHGMLLRRSMIDEIGGFDPAFFMYYEDVDLCLRARAAGFRLLYVPAARMWHHVAASTRADLPGRWRYKAESAARLYRKHNPNPAVALLKLGLTAAWILGRELGRGKLTLAARLAGPYLRGVWQGLREAKR